MVTKNHDKVTGFKTLGMMPKALESLTIDEKNARIIDTGTLTNISKFCNKYEGKFGSGKSVASERVSTWGGSWNWNEYKEYLVKGDPQTIGSIREKTRSNIKRIESEYKEQLVTFKPDVEGMFFDVGMVLSGEPECWFKEEVREVDSQKISFVLSGAFTANFDKDKIIEASAKILALCKVLEDHKIQTEISIVCCNEQYDKKHKKEVLYLYSKVKSFDEPLNYVKASALLSPTYQRRLTFKVAELQADEVKKGYGYVSHPKGAIKLDNAYDLEQLEKKILGGK